MNYTEAMKECRRVGTAHASGNALRAMYARLIAYHCCLAESTASQFYQHLQSHVDDTAITDEAQRLMRNPLDACEIGLR